MELDSSPCTVQFANDALRYIEADQLRTPGKRGLRQVVQRIADGTALGDGIGR